MERNLQHIISLLSRTPATLNSLLRDLPKTWTHRNEGGNTWSAFDVVAHLIYGEPTDWIPRARILLEFGETRTFETFDLTHLHPISRIMAHHYREAVGRGGHLGVLQCAG